MKKECLVQDHLKEKLKDPYFKELYELEEQKNAIVNKIIAYRVKHNLSQTQLAERVNVTQQHISKIESGEFSSIMTLEKVLLAIGLTVRMQVVPIKDSNIKHIKRSVLRQAKRK